MERPVLWLWTKPLPCRYYFSIMLIDRRTLRIERLLDVGSTRELFARLP